MPRENWAAGRTMSAYPNKHGKDKNKNKKNTMIMGIDEVKLNFSEYSRDTKGAISFLKQWRAKKDDTNAPRPKFCFREAKSVEVSRGFPANCSGPLRPRKLNNGVVQKHMAIGKWWKVMIPHGGWVWPQRQLATNRSQIRSSADCKPSFCGSKAYISLPNNRDPRKIIREKQPKIIHLWKNMEPLIRDVQ